MPHFLPPDQLPSGTSSVNADHRRQALRELRDLQRRPLTRGRFNLYSRIGHIYLAATSISMSVLVGVLVAVTARANITWDVSTAVSAVAGGLFLLCMAVNLAVTYVKHRRITRLLHGRCPNAATTSAPPPTAARSAGRR